MGDLNRTGWTVTASSGANPSNVLDGSAATYWQSAAGYPHHLILDLGSALTFDTVKFQKRTYGFQGFPEVMEVYTSDDGIDWGTAVGAATWPIGYPVEFIKCSRQTKRYVKIVGVSSTTNTTMSCVELNLQLDPLNRYLWTAAGSGEKDAAHAAQKALDGYGEYGYGQYGTYFLTGDLDGAQIEFPHELIVDMGESLEIDYLKVVAPAAIMNDGAIPYNHTIPALARFYTSLNGSDWTLRGEQVWPLDRREHYVYSKDAYGTLASVVCRFFKLVGADQKGHEVVGDNYHRMAVAEIYAGKLATGDPYKVYSKVIPTILEDLTSEIMPPSDTGIVDYVRLALDPYSPGDLQLAKMEAKIRVWTTSGLAFYPEFCCSVWNLPANWRTLPLETLSIFAEGQHLAGNGVGTVADFELLRGRQSMQSYFDFLIAWSYVFVDIAPRVSKTLYDVDPTVTDPISLDDVEGMFSNFCIWNSLAGSAPSHDDEDVSRLLISDHYLLLVWAATYVEPPPTAAYLNVRKVLNPSDDPGLFNLQIDGVTQAANQGNGGSTGAIVVVVGSHIVGETAGTGTELSRYLTTYGGDASALGVVVAVAGETKVAIITNTVKGHRPEAPHCVLNPGPGIEPDFSVAVQPLEP